MIYKPHNYQQIAIDHVINSPKTGVFLDMGLGKGSITLSAIVHLKKCLEAAKVLVIGPKLVAAQTWPAEIQKWDHTKHLKVSVVAGTPKQRMRALQVPADIYTISRDSVVWLVEDAVSRAAWDFDMLVIDELSSFKNHASQRFRSLRKIAPLCDRVVGLTGTPAPNSLLDLWSQIYLLDQGARLGKNITAYREAYFSKNFNGFGYSLKPQYKDVIHDKIKDICISMTAKDYLDMPARIDSVREVHLNSMERYKEFMRSEVLQLDDGGDITPLSAAALYSKLLQFCNGSVYDRDRITHYVDDTKLDMLEEMVEELQGEPLLVFYSFQSDRERILKRIKCAEAFEGKDGVAIVDRWNRKEIKVLLAHPASIGHGVNMQFGGHNMAWFGLPWSLELYQQSVARLDRQGQEKAVINSLLVAKGTVEELVMARLGEKTVTQNDLIDALKKHLY